MHVAPLCAGYVKRIASADLQMVGELLQKMQPEPTDETHSMLDDEPSNSKEMLLNRAIETPDKKLPHVIGRRNRTADYLDAKINHDKDEVIVQPAGSSFQSASIGLEFLCRVAATSAGSKQCRHDPGTSGNNVNSSSRLLMDISNGLPRIVMTNHLLDRKKTFYGNYNGIKMDLYQNSRKNISNEKSKNVTMNGGHITENNFHVNKKIVSSADSKRQQSAANFTYQKISFEDPKNIKNEHTSIYQNLKGKLNALFDWRRTFSKVNIHDVDMESVPTGNKETLSFERPDTNGTRANDLTSLTSSNNYLGKTDNTTDKNGNPSVTTVSSWASILMRNKTSDLDESKLSVWRSYPYALGVMESQHPLGVIESQNPLGVIESQQTLGVIESAAPTHLHSLPLPSKLTSAAAHLNPEAFKSESLTNNILIQPIFASYGAVQRIDKLTKLDTVSIRPFLNATQILRSAIEHSSSSSCSILGRLNTAMHLLKAIDSLLLSLPTSLEELLQAARDPQIEDFIFTPEGKASVKLIQ